VGARSEAGSEAGESGYAVKTVEQRERAAGWRSMLDHTMEHVSKTLDTNEERMRMQGRAIFAIFKEKNLKPGHSQKRLRRSVHAD
jgi:hypothetical protein